jgi:hypothetical protein
MGAEMSANISSGSRRAPLRLRPGSRVAYGPTPSSRLDPAAAADDDDDDAFTKFL